MSTELFPIIQPPVTQQSNSFPLYREVAWNFEIGKPIFKNGSPVIVTGREAIQTWVYKALLTQRARYEIYTHNFGSDLETLIGENYSIHTKRAEAIRYVKEALQINPYITEITNIKVQFKLGDLSISATVITVYGEVSVNV